MTTRQEFVTAARSLVGTPWRHQGRVIGKALDCIGTLGAAGVKSGLIESMSFLPADYGRTPDGTFLTRIRQLGLLPIPVSERQPADILCFSMHGQVWHTGILTAPPPNELMVHGFFKNRKVVEQSFYGVSNTYGMLTHVFTIPWLED